jgi:hypothetical protein
MAATGCRIPYISKHDVPAFHCSYPLFIGGIANYRVKNTLFSGIRTMERQVLHGREEAQNK